MLLSTDTLVSYWVDVSPMDSRAFLVVFVVYVQIYYIDDEVVVGIV